MKPLSRPTARIAGALALAAVAVLGLRQGQSAVAQGGFRNVDLELVLAVDVSRSMDEQEHHIQRMGYVEAFRHRDVINALMSGPEGKIAVTYMEWANDTYPIIPWTILDSKEAALDFAERLENEPKYNERRTSISTALYAAVDLINENDIAAHRRVIDVSGDGANNSGPPVEEARDFVLKQDITINGLPIMLNDGQDAPRQGFDIAHLDRYYRHCVIGGQAAFIAPVFNLDQLAVTIRKKLVLEIADLGPAPDIFRGAAAVQFGDASGSGAQLTLAQLKLPTEKTDCMSGEKARGRGGFGGGFGNFPQ